MQEGEELIAERCQKCGSGLLSRRYIQDGVGAIYRGATELHCELCGWSSYSERPIASPSPPVKRRTSCNKPRSVEQFDLATGETVRTWPSLTRAARAVGVHASAVYNCCTGKQRQTQGYGWRYASTSVPYTYSRAVDQYDLATGEIIRTWPSVKIAFQELHIPRTTVYDVLRGWRQQAGGYGWRWAKEE